MRRFILIILSLFIMNLCLVSCKTDDMRQEEFIVQEGIKELGIISVWSDLDNHQYAYKDEIFINDEQLIKNVVALIKDGEINDGETNKVINIDRLPAEYEIQIYYDEETVKCYYWYNETKYNFTISGINGVITIDGEAMDEIMQTITGETDRKKIVDPY